MGNIPPNGHVNSDAAADSVGPEVRAASFQFLTELAQELSKGTVNLPCFPDIVLRIRKALNDPQGTPQKTVRLVGTEPRLAAKLLQTANSAAFNPTGKPLVDLRTAVTRLGHQIVQSVTMAFAVQQMRAEQSLRHIAKPLSDLWERSLAVAAICQVLGRRTKVPEEEAFLAGLLHGIGRLYIMVRAADNLKHAPEFTDLIADWHPAIGKSILENWGFAEEMYDAVGRQHEYEHKSKRPDLTAVLIVAAILAAELAAQRRNLSKMNGVTAFTTLGLTEQDCNAILDHAHHQLASLYDALGR
jgi:HD-like signal output (HDOD) protein